MVDNIGSLLMHVKATPRGQSPSDQRKLNRMGASFGIDELRIFLHVLGVTVWIGGQIVMLSLLPILRSSSDSSVTAVAAQGFQRVAWPAFGLTVFTGIWNILSVDMAEVSTSYNMVFGIKFLLVIASGAAAFIHSRASKPSIKGMTGGIGFLAAVIAMVLGYAL